MDIVTRKLNFVQQFLRIADEDLIEKMELLLHLERKKRVSNDVKPMPLDDFYQMIDKAEDDIVNERLTDARKLLTNIDI